MAKRSHSRTDRTTRGRSNRRGHTTSLGAAATAALAAAAAGVPVHAATFTVTNLLDGVGPAPAGSLREALESANTNPGADTVEFQAGLAGTIALAGTLGVEGPLTVDGPGSAALTIQGDGTGSVFYAFYDSDPSTHVVSLSGMTITGGYADFYGLGGGILSATSLVLDDVHVVDNQAEFFGGGIGVFSLNEATLEVTDSLIASNEVGGPDLDGAPAAFYFAGGGGGVGMVGNVAARFENTVIRDNSAEFPFAYDEKTKTFEGAASLGGGIFAWGFYVEPDEGPSIELDHVTVANNSAGFAGGGVSMLNPLSLFGPGPDPDEFGASTLTIVDSVITGNETTSVLEGAPSFPLFILFTGGGGVHFLARGAVDISSTLIADNKTNSVGGGASLLGADEVRIDSSTVSSNQAVVGGGLAIAAVAPTIVNSTITGNQAAGDLPFAYAVGGGVIFGNLFYLYAVEPEALVLHSTIAGNTAEDDGGGIVSPVLPTHIRNSIVAQNTGGAGANPDLLTEYLGGGGPSSGEFYLFYSLIGDAGTATTTDFGGTTYGEDPDLGALIDNGGPTIGAILASEDASSPLPTRKPSPSSPAVDTADPAFAAPPTEDERGTGFNRVENGRLDRGAIEIQDTVVRFTSPTFTAAENSGQATITVERVEGDGPASVDYASSNGTAGEPDDYDETTGTLNWGDNDFSVQSFDVPLVADGIVEGDETVTLTLAVPGPAPRRPALRAAPISVAEEATLIGDPGEATLTILDSLSVVQIPTLGGAGAAALGAGLAGAAVAALRRRKGKGAPR